MADKNLNETSPSKLDIYSKLLDIAKNYTGDDKTDYLKTGLFGYITESMAMMIRDSSYHKAMLYNESFLNTAVIPKSVYNWAKMFNIEIAKASPAYATIKIIISKDNLQFNSKDTKPAEKYGFNGVMSKDWLIIDKSNAIIAGDYYFSLEHSILIERSVIGSNTKYIAKYILSEPGSTNYQTTNISAYLPVERDDNNIEITARAYQYKTTKITRQLSSTRMLNKVQLYTFEDQFAGAKLTYSENGSSDENDIELLYSNIGSSSEGKKVAYYDLTNENQLEIIFKGGTNGFIPAANSRLNLYLYTTKGSDVPENFSGDAIFRANDDSIGGLGAVIQFNPTTIIGGSDMPTTEKIKQTIIRQLSTCNTIVTENDINNYFSVLTNLLDSINNGKVTFIKNRDDVMRRVFNAYVLLRDGMNEDGTSTAGESSFISKCVPTNTITATFPARSFQNAQTLKFPKIKLNPTSNTWYEDSSATDNYYYSPFYIYVSLAPIKKVKYIYNMTDNSSSLSCIKDEADFGNYYINPISLRLYRGTSSDSNAPESKYTVTAKFGTNFDSITRVKASLADSEFKIKFSNDNESSIDITPGYAENEYIDFDEDSKILTLTFTLNVDSDNEFKFGDGTDYGTKIYLLQNNSQTDVNGATMESSGGTSQGLNESYNISLEITKRSKASEYKTDDKLYLFRNLDEIMSSDISVDTTTENDITVITGITISDIPVIHSSYLEKKSKNKDKFVEQLFTYISLLKENLDRLETSTFFNLKFYNTYGPSYLYNTTTTNINLELTVHINTNDDSLKSEIQSYIRRAVDKSNDNSAIKVSQIVALLGKDETYGQYIKYIEFEGLNGTFNQYINKIADIDETQYPPEWLNIDADKLTNIKVQYD